MTEHKRGQFFIIVAIMFCVTLLLVATYVISVIGSPPWARVGGVQYTYTNVKAQSVRVVEVSLANVTNSGLPNSLLLNLEDWKNSSESLCAQQGYSLALAYANVWNGTSWNETLGWSKASVSFTLLLQSGASEIYDEYTVQTELYVNITDVVSFNSTHLSVSVEVWKEAGAPVIGATVNVFALDDNGTVIGSTEAHSNGDGTYTALIPSGVGAEDVYVSVLDSRSIHVQALEDDV